MARRVVQTKSMRYWLAFDVSVRATVKGLFEWLDDMDANECGSFAATFVTTKSWPQVVAELKDAAGQGIRIYLIGKRPRDGKVVGQFILGSRKAAPWAGYADRPQPVEEEEA